MKTLDTLETIIEWRLGQTWLGRHELGQLRRGDLVLTRTMAGTGFDLYADDTWLARTESWIWKAKDGQNRLCPRILSLRVPGEGEPEPERGGLAGDFVPLKVILGASAATHGQLAALGPGSLVNLGIRHGEEETAWLAFGPHRLARGTVMVAGELMALRIDEVYFATPESKPRHLASQESGNLGVMAAKTYRFTMPDIFTRRHIEAMEALHVEAARNIDPRGAGPWKVSMVDQLNFQEYLDMAGPDTRLRVFPATPRTEAPPLPQGIALWCDLELPPSLDGEGLDEALRLLVQRPVGGGILVALPPSGPADQELGEALGVAWRRIGGMSPRPGPVLGTIAELSGSRKPEGNRQGSPALDPWIGPWEMIILVRLTGPGGTLDLVYPHRVLLPWLPALGRRP